MVKLLFATWLILLTGCQQILEMEVRYRGASSPRNDREQLIFDYYQALKDKQYEDAYQLRAWHVAPFPISFQYFEQIHTEHHHSLPIEISIGEERKSGSNEVDHCEYNYTVYAVSSEGSVLMSGELTLHSKPGEPEVCLIGYNSAFGSVP